MWAMTTAAAPRHYMPRIAQGAQAWTQVGLPHDRNSRIAARRSFVHLKQSFMRAVDSINGPRGDWLRHQVRQANEAVDLWLLRGAVFNGLSARDPEGRRLSIELHRALDTVFPDSSGDEFMLPL